MQMGAEESIVMWVAYCRRQCQSRLTDERSNVRACSRPFINTTQQYLLTYNTHKFSAVKYLKIGQRTDK